MIASGDPETVGEILRSLTFIGEGHGATENSKVRSDAHPWTGEAKAPFYRNHISSHPDQVAAGAHAGSGYTYDTMPLGAIPKILMFFESIGSLVTVGLVASRAVNILK